MDDRGNDTIDETAQDSTITGGAGNDSLTGDTTQELQPGEPGSTLSGGEGNDDLEHQHEGLADHPDEVREERTIPPEAKKALEREYPQLKSGHGTHDAAMKGLQTDASGSYTPPKHPRED